MPGPFLGFLVCARYTIQEIQTNAESVEQSVCKGPRFCHKKSPVWGGGIIATPCPDPFLGFLVCARYTIQGNPNQCREDGAVSVRVPGSAIDRDDGAGCTQGPKKCDDTGPGFGR